MPPANLGSWLGSTISTAVKPLYDVFIEHAMYLFATGRNVRDLHTNIGTFVGLRDDVKQQLETDRRNGFERHEAKTWLERANKAITDEKGNRERYGQRCKIFGCWAPNCWSNYKISKKAAETLVEVNRCSEHRPPTGTEPPPRPVEPIQVESVSLKASQVSILNQVLGYIKDDATVGLVGIWGPRQVGKTLLLKRINNSFGASTDTSPTHPRGSTSEQTGDIVDHSASEIIEDANNTGRSDRQESSFHFVIYVTASINCTVKNIQSEILRRLKMQVQDGDSETTRATKISEFLQDKSFLVLLDDLQNDLDLAAVGLPHPLGVHGQLKRKVVITTRSQSVCDEMHANRAMNVSGLDKDEALQLFQQIVGSKNLYSNPRIGEHAKDIVDVLRARPSELIKFGTELHRIGDPKQLEDVILNKKEYWQQPSRATVFKQAMEYIKRKPVDVIGIWGLGGVGKTHLLEKIQDQANSLFDHVISVTASKGCSVERIQGQIVENHKLEKADGVKNQAVIISRFLKGKSFVLLLDDLWDRIDLGAVGIHPSEGQQKRKVVITTRDMTVCGLMEVRKVINVACLPDDEAWQLFQDKVGQGTLSSSPRIEALAKELVKELKGLPLALITTGRAMWSKSDPEEWQYAIDYMKKSCCDENDPMSMETVFSQLKYSYDSLKNGIRECFLTCSLWPEDWVFKMEELYECWIGLGIVDVDKSDIHECYREVHNIVGELKAACLLEVCEYTTYRSNPQYRESQPQRPLSTKVSVKMHDVVRDMAIWISNDCGKSNDKWVVRAGIGANSSRNTIPWGKVECVSLMCSDMKKLPPFGSDNCCMKLKKLYLNRNFLSEFIAASGTSQSFTALTYLDLSRNYLTGISESLCGLTNLEYLNVSNNVSIKKVPVSLRRLKKLKFLYLGGTAIRRIPKGIIKSLKELKVVDLITDGTTTDHEFGTDWIIRELCTLANLKAVDIAVGSETLLQEARNLPIRDLVISNLREASGRCLTDGNFSSGIERRTLYQLHIRYCSVEKIIGTNKPEPFGALKVLALVNADLKEIMWKGTTPQDLFPRLTHVDIYRCKLQRLSWVMYLPCLQYLDVRRCDNLKQAFRSTENCGEKMRRPGQESSRASVDRFPCLISLCFEGNPELISLCDSDVTFPSLESLDITRCPKLKKLPFTRQSLPKKLAELWIDATLLMEVQSYGLNSAPNSNMKFRRTPGGPMVRVTIF